MYMDRQARISITPDITDSLVDIILSVEEVPF